MKKHNKTYILSLSKQEMKDLGFKYDFEIQEYIYKFPVYKSSKNEPLIFCKLGIDEENNKVFFNVCDLSGELYTSYYNREYGKPNFVVETIDRNIEKEFKKLGVKENEQ